MVDIATDPCKAARARSTWRTRAKFLRRDPGQRHWLCGSSAKWILFRALAQPNLRLRLPGLRQIMTKRTRVSLSVLALLSVLSIIPIMKGSIDGSRGQSSEPATKTQAQTAKSGGVVYVCACLKTKSCSCMTMAKTEGPCSCGTEGGPPLKAVPKNGAWAKENRDALAK